VIFTGRILVVNSYKKEAYMEDHLEPRLVEILHKLGLSEQSLRDHVLRPENFGDSLVQFDLRIPSDGDPDKEPKLPPPSKGWFYHLDVPQLEIDLQTMLRKCLSGYSMQLRRNGRVLINDSYRMAVLPADSGPNRPAGVPWTPAVPMHVASLSKLVTAMAMTRVLEYYNISPDTSIRSYLPKYWTKGPGIESISFRDLLNHKSGLVVPGAPGACDFLFMKDRIAHGVSGLPGYLNINYALCRILICTIDAPWLFDLLPTTNDNYWDLTTTSYYSSYVNDNIFAPAGVSSTLDHTDANALAYPVPSKAPGWNSGDQTPRCGAIAWHFSVNDLLAIMAAFRRSGAILPSYNSQRMLDRQFGIDAIKDTNLGRIYAKGGFWSEGMGVTVEQCNAFFLPKGMELVILANSTYCATNTSFMYDVLKTIDKNIQVNLFKATVAAVSVLGAIGLITRKVRAKR
jgi:CubicO group peptidase (beta-lactamase class C family)